MKKSLASVFALVVLLFSVAANASQITGSDASGAPGDTVSLHFSFSGDYANFLGGDFTIGYDNTKLSYSQAVGASGDFDPYLFLGGVLYLSYNGKSAAPFGSIFSIEFDIADPYPTGLPDLTDVTVSSLLYFDGGFDLDGGIITIEERLAAIAPTVTVSARTVPEPGVLGLTGLALLIMTVSARRRRANRG